MSRVAWPTLAPMKGARVKSKNPAVAGAERDKADANGCGQINGFHACGCVFYITGLAPGLNLRFTCGSELGEYSVVPVWSGYRTNRKPGGGFPFPHAAKPPACINRSAAGIQIFLPVWTSGTFTARVIRQCALV
jgi:hypothetical protein